MVVNGKLEMEIFHFRKKKDICLVKNKFVESS